MKMVLESYGRNKQWMERVIEDEIPMEEIRETLRKTYISESETFLRNNKEHEAENISNGTKYKR